MSLPMHLRAYTEKTKDEQTRDFFNVPLAEQLPAPNATPVVVKPAAGRARSSSASGLQGMDINAVLSVEGKEDVYVSVPPDLAFLSLSTELLAAKCERRTASSASAQSPFSTELHALLGLFGLLGGLLHASQTCIRGSLRHARHHSVRSSLPQMCPSHRH